MVARKIERAYARSDDWAMTSDALLPVGSVFEWEGFYWEIVAHFHFPCCDTRCALVRKIHPRRYGPLKTWTGLCCPASCLDEDGKAPTYTVEHE